MSGDQRRPVDVFYESHVCRVVPMPDCVARTFAQIAANPTVYHAMNGPSEFAATGISRSSRLRIGAAMML